MLGSRENSVNEIDDASGSVETIKEEEEEDENCCNIHQFTSETESEDSWDEESDIDEILLEEEEEPLYENGQETIRRDIVDTRDIAMFDPIPVVRSESKESQEETLATLQSLLLVKKHFCFILFAMLFLSKQTIFVSSKVR